MFKEKKKEKWVWLIYTQTKQVVYHFIPIISCFIIAGSQMEVNHPAVKDNKSELFL